MARARSIDGLTESQPYATAAARVVAVRSRELRDHARGVLDLDDIEPLHDMRVATRRLRAALEVFEPCFPRKRFAAALRDVKEIADALGERRDRDVAIAALEDFADSSGAADRAGVESFIASLRAEQEEANQAIAPMIADARLEVLDGRLAALVAAAEDRGRVEDGQG